MPSASTTVVTFESCFSTDNKWKEVRTSSSIIADIKYQQYAVQEHRLRRDHLIITTNTYINSNICKFKRPQHRPYRFNSNKPLVQNHHLVALFRSSVVACYTIPCTKSNLSAPRANKYTNNNYRLKLTTTTTLMHQRLLTSKGGLQPPTNTNKNK